MRSAALGVPAFRLLFAGRAVSLLGNAVAPVALAFAVLEVSGSAAALGIVLAARTLPQVGFLLVGGVVADRLPRHRVMVVAGVASGVTQAVAAGLLLGHVATVPLLAVVELLNGVAFSFSSPALAGLVPQLLPAPLLQSGNAALALVRSSIAVVGAAVGGIVVAVTSPGVALAFDAATFLVGAALLARIRLPAGARLAVGSAFADLREGWRAFRSRQWLWVVVAQFSVVNACLSGVVFVLGPVVADRYLAGARSWGFVLAADAAGAVLGGLVALRWRPRRLLLVATLAVFGETPFLLAIGAHPGTVALVAAALLGGVCIEQFGILWDTALQQHVPGDLLSRVSSYDSLGSFVAIPVGQAVAGPVAAAIGVAETAYAAAALVTLVTALTLLAPGVRRLARRDVAPRPALPVATLGG